MAPQVPLRCAILATLVLLALDSRPVEAQARGTTQTGYVFCLSLENFNTQTRLLVSGDRVAWERYMNDSANGCGALRAGLSVYYEGAGIRNIGMIRFRPEGSTVWFYTNTEAVRRSGF